MERRIGDLPAKRQILLYAAITAIYGAAIAWFAFLLVTLRQALELADPWSVVWAFGLVTIVLVVAYRASGLHRPY